MTKSKAGRPPVGDFAKADENLWFSLIVLVKKRRKNGDVGRIWPICYRTSCRFLPEGRICQNKNDIKHTLTVNQPTCLYPYSPAPAEALIAGFDYDDNGNRSGLDYYLDGTDTGDIVSVDYGYNRDNMLTVFETTGLEFEFGDGTQPHPGPAVVDGLGRLAAAGEILTKTDQSSLAHDYLRLLYAFGIDKRDDYRYRRRYVDG